MSGEYTFGASDDIVRRIRENLPHIEWEQPLSAERERLAADEIERLRALITEWATALKALREVGLRYGNANWNRAYDRWDAIEKALFEEARREQ